MNICYIFFWAILLLFGAPKGHSKDIISINNNWCFYWQSLASPSHSSLPCVESVELPHFWKSNHIGKGFASYQKEVHVPPGWGKNLSLNLFRVIGSVAVYANGRLIYSQGEIETSQNSNNFKIIIDQIYFNLHRKGKLLVTIYVSSWKHNNPGLGLIQIAPELIMREHIRKRESIDFGVYGAVGLMILYHFGLYLSRRDERSTLWFALFSLCLTGFNIVLNKSYLVFIGTDLSGETILNIAYICLYGMMICFPLYFRSIFPIMSPVVTRTTIVVGFTAILFVVLAPYEWDSAINIPILSFMMITFIYAVFITFRGVFKREQSAIPFSIGIMALFMSTIYDTAVNYGFISSEFISVWGLLFFTGSQSYLLSVRFSKAFRDVGQAKLEIVELNQELSSINTHLETIVEEKTRDIKSILETIKQGIFTIGISENGTLEIVGDHSVHFEKITRYNKFDSIDPIDLILKNSNLSLDKFDQARQSLLSAIGMDVIAFEVNAHLLPHEIRRDDQGRFYELDWTPIIDSSGIISKILVTIRDVTEIRELRKMAKDNLEDISLISEIIEIKPKKFHSFIASSCKLLSENKRLIQGNMLLRDEIIKTLFINMHTIKGAARSYNLKKISELAHTIETHYSKIHKGDITWNQDTLLADIDDLQAILDKYLIINDEKLNRKYDSSKIEISRTFVERAIRDYERFDFMYKCCEEKEALDRINREFIKLNYTSIGNILSESYSSASRIARDLGKKEPIIKIYDRGYRVDTEIREVLADAMNHIVRNAVDHGLETTAQRIDSGKPEQGRLEVYVSEDKNGDITIRCRDDGRGLFLDAIRQKAITSGFIDKNASATDVAYCIFEQLSTASTVTDISGRGVGMGAVKEFLEKHDCRIDIDFRGDTLYGFQPVDFVITIAKRHCKFVPFELHKID